MVITVHFGITSIMFAVLMTPIRISGVIGSAYSGQYAQLLLVATHGPYLAHRPSPIEVRVGSRFGFVVSSRSRVAGAGWLVPLCE